MSETILDVRDVVVEYTTSSRPARAVDHVSFTLDRGEFLGVVGESGCGKSTLLFAIAQLLTPPAQLVSGEVLFKGRNIVELSAAHLARGALARLFGRHAKRDERPQPGQNGRRPVR